MSSKCSSSDASLELMCRAQCETQNFPQRFLERIKDLPEDRAILFLQTAGTQSGIPLALSYLAWPRPVLVRTAPLRDSVDLDGLLRGRISAIVLANQEAPANFPKGERLGPTVTYISIQQPGS